MRAQEDIETRSSTRGLPTESPGSVAVADPDEVGQNLGDGLQFMTADELARMLHVTTAWVYTQTRDDQIPHVALGRYVRYRRSAIARWLAENERRGA